MRLETSAEWERVRRIVDGGAADDFRALVADYHPLAYSVAYKVLGNRQDSEEVVQDAFVKIFHALARFRGESSLKTWILRIVTRLSLNRRRDQGRSAWRRLGLHQRGEEETEMSGEHLPTPPGYSPEAMCITAETRRLMLDLLEELPASLREALILNSFEELSYDEIARVLQVPVGTVSSRIHSARDKLCKKLQAHDLL